MTGKANNKYDIFKPLSGRNKRVRNNCHWEKKALRLQRVDVHETPRLLFPLQIHDETMICCISYDESYEIPWTENRLLPVALLSLTFFSLYSLENIIFNLHQFFHYANSKADVSVYNKFLASTFPMYIVPKHFIPHMLQLHPYTHTWCAVHLLSCKKKKELRRVWAAEWTCMRDRARERERKQKQQWFFRFLFFSCDLFVASVISLLWKKSHKWIDAVKSRILL